MIKCCDKQNHSNVQYIHSDITADSSLTATFVEKKKPFIMEHSELIAEMAYIEKLSTQERLKLARRRRMQQMKKYNQKEVGGSKKEKTLQNEAQKRRRENGKRVNFVSSVMLLEAAARNDIEEGKS